MLLSELARGQAGVVEAVHGEGSVRRHLLDMGLTPNAEVTLQKAAPMGDPIQVTVRGYELTLRLSEADNVLVQALDPQDRPDVLAGADIARPQAAGTAAAPTARADRPPLPHPGLGEFGPAEAAYRAHARRAKEKSAGHEQRGTAPAAQMQKAPGKQQYGGADQQDALRQPAVPRQKRAEAKEGGGQHQRPRVQRTQRQGRGAPAHAICGNALRGGQVPRRDRLRAPRRAATQDRKGDSSG